MLTRVHIVIDQREHDAFRARARAEGKSLSEWLREAGRKRLRSEGHKRIRSLSDLDSFFAECDRREVGVEPDWEQHLAVAARSRLSGIEPT